MRCVLLLALFSSSSSHAQVSIQEYPLPHGLFAHDVWASAAPGGPVYFSAQRSGHLGILDPKSGKVETVALGGGSSPHGVIADKDGSVWLTDGGQNAIVRVDAKTRAVKVWALPEGSRYANLNTATFDGKGLHWFTGQSGYYGRLDLRSGDMKVFDAPKGSGPYGIQTTPDGTVYFASLASSYVGRIDSDSGKVTVLEPPTKGQGARRVWADSRGQIWVSEWNSGQVSRYDPRTGAWKAWRLPGDRPQAYAVYVDDQDKVWLSEWSANAMVRFDPDTERFDVFPSDRRGANVRQILGRPGEVWAPESGTDRLVVFRTR